MKKFILLFCIGGVALMAKAQTVTVTGTITDSSNGQKLPWVNVLVKGTSFGTTSNTEGQYSISVNPATDTLVYTFLGYASHKEAVNGRASIDVALEEKASELSEIVVTALGIKREKKDLGYSVQQLESEAITEVRQPNLVDALAGKVAGLQTTQGSSGVGSSSRIIIRGETSLSGTNQPLFVIDGVPVSNTSIPNNTENIESGFQEVDYGNGIAEISPDDIRSVNVLKGPGAAALYGARAANGVIVIETKDGRRTPGLGVSINSSVTIDQISTIPQYQNVYGQGSGGQFAFEDGNDGGIGDGGLVSFGPEMNGQPIPQYDSPSTDVNGNPVRGGDVIARNGNPIQPTPFVANPDNIQDFFQTGITSNQHIAVAGANDEGSFRLSYSRLDNQGVIPNTDLHRNGLALSGTYNFSDRLTARAFANYIRSSSTHRPALGYGSENLMYLFTWMGRQVNLEAAKDYWQAGQEGFQQFTYNYKWLDNPYFSVYENTNGFNKDRILGNASVSYQISDQLNVRLRSGIDNYNDLRASKRAFSTQRFKNGAYREDEISYAEINTDILVSYSHDLSEQWMLNLSAGANQFTQRMQYKSLVAGELSVPGVYNFENSKIPLAATQNNARKRINSIYGLGNISFASRFFLDLTLRNDWSSTLPSGNNSFAYYSVSSSIILSEFMQLPLWISYAKLRLSSASVGNDTDSFQLNNTLRFNQNYGAFPLLTNAATLLNASLKPERINALEVGGEAWFFNDQLGVDIALYQNTAKDQIIGLPSSAASGYTSRVVNGGKIQSRGLELILRATPIRSSNFNWHTTVNFSKSASYVRQLPEGIDQYVTGFTKVYTSTENSVFYIADPKGGRIGDMYGTGFQKTEDGQIIYGANGLPLRDSELRYLGNYNPDFMLGFANDFNYRNFSFGFLIDWRQGGTIVSRTKAIGSTAGVLEETLAGRTEGIVGEGVVNVGTADQPNYVENTTEVSAAEFYNQFYNRANEESALYDASYVKLRQLNLSYTLPRALTQRWNLQEVKFGIIARNLLLITENPHVDPELSTLQGRNFAYGVEDMSYPSSRSYGFNLQLKF